MYQHIQEYNVTISLALHSPIIIFLFLFSFFYYVLLAKISIKDITKQ